LVFFGDVFWDFDVFCCKKVDNRLFREFMEGVFSCKEFIEDDAKMPPVNFFTEVVADFFWCDVVDGTFKRRGSDFGEFFV
jgi:Cys-tRNA synthase (O-phospho-L-seryl-tRNA:Cys-tRNA synthase)